MLNPLLLWFLPLALLPVILHLLNLNRLREVELPTFRFLMEGYVQERSRIKLIEWLLLLLRTAVVLLVVGALSRPVVQRFSTLFGSGVKDVVFVLDAGMSTGLVTEGSSALHRGREAVRAAVGRLGPADFVTVVRAGMEPRVLHRAVLGDGKRLLAELDSVEPDPGSADLAAAVGEALASPARGPRSLWIVSDGQARSWNRLRDSPVARQVPDDVQLVLVDIGSGQTPPNVALLGDPPRPQRPVVGLPVELTARIEAAGNGSTGDDAAIEVPLSVTVDDELVTQTTVTIPPGQVVSVPLSVVPARAGVIKARLDLPADAFPFDDSMVFVLNVERRVGVVVVTAPGVEGLADPALYLTAALESPLASLTATLGESSPQVEGEERIARSLDVQVVRADLLDERRIQEADVIVVADARLDGHRSQWLRRRDEEGAGLVVFAGPKQGPGEEIAGLGSFAGRDPALLRWKEPVGDIDDETGGRGFGPVDLTHPLFAPFRTPAERPDDGTRSGREGSCRRSRCGPGRAGDGAGPARRRHPGDRRDEARPGEGPRQRSGRDPRLVESPRPSGLRPPPAAGGADGAPRPAGDRRRERPSLRAGADPPRGALEARGGAGDRSGRHEDGDRDGRRRRPRHRRARGDAPDRVLRV